MNKPNPLLKIVHDLLFGKDRARKNKLAT